MSRTAAAIVIKAIFRARMPASLAHAAPVAKRSGSVWAEPIQRLAAEGISPEQAVGGAIGRIKQILSE
jgi:hypothetical protein